MPARRPSTGPEAQVVLARCHFSGGVRFLSRLPSSVRGDGRRRPGPCSCPPGGHAGPRLPFIPHPIHPSPVQSKQGLLLILPPHPHPHPHTRPARQGKAQGQPKLTRPAPAPPRALTRIPQSSSSPSIPPPAASEPPPLVSTFSTVSSQPPFPALPQDHATSRSPTRSGSAIYFFHPHHPVGRTHIVARFPVANGSQRLVTRPGASACSTVPDFYPLSPAFFIITNPLPLSA